MPSPSVLSPRSLNIGSLSTPATILIIIIIILSVLIAILLCCCCTQRKSLHSRQIKDLEMKGYSSTSLYKSTSASTPPTPRFSVTQPHTWTSLFKTEEKRGAPLNMVLSPQTTQTGTGIRNYGPGGSIEGEKRGGPLGMLLDRKKEKRKMPRIHGGNAKFYAPGLVRDKEREDERGEGGEGVSRYEVWKREAGIERPGRVLGRGLR